MNQPAPNPNPPDTPAAPLSIEDEWSQLVAACDRLEDAALPPSVVATPDELHRRVGDDVRWWRPSWQDTMQHVGWRWVFLVPVLMLAALLLVPLRWMPWPLVLVEAKVLLFAGAIALTLAGYVFRRAARARTQPFCIFCGYNLTGLPDHYRCPECGRPFSWRVIAEYRRDPEWFIERYRALRRLPQADVRFDAGPGRRKRRRDGT